MCYRLDDIVGSPCDMHRNQEGEIWVSDFEVRALSALPPTF